MTASKLATAAVAAAALSLAVGSAEAQQNIRTATSWPGGVHLEQFAQGFSKQVDSITGGKVNAETLEGKIQHKGGLTLANGHESLTVENFTVKIGPKNVIRAEVAGGGKVRLADLDLSKAKIKQRGGKVVVSNVDVLLAKRAAGALSAVFGLPDLTGADLGDATVKIKT